MHTFNEFVKRTIWTSERLAAPDAVPLPAFYPLVYRTNCLISLRLSRIKLRK